MRLAAVVLIAVVLAGPFAFVQWFPHEDATACVLARSFSASPRADTLWREAVYDASGLWSVRFENHGLLGAGIDLYEVGARGSTLVHSERVNFLWDRTWGGVSDPVEIRIGGRYRYAITPVGSAGAWASCSVDLVSGAASGSEATSSRSTDEALPLAGGPPKASFTTAPAKPMVGDQVQFDGSASRDDGTIISYAWTFGDGLTGAGRIAFHTYSLYGTFTVGLTVTDDTGRTGSASQTLRVVVGPTAAFTYSPAVPQTGGAVSFDASGTSDPDANIASYRWDFGDGTPVVTLATPLTTHAYAAYGTYRVTLRVTDADSLWSEVSSRITVYAPPTASFSFSPSAPLIGEGVAFDGTASTDPDSAIASYAWDFGDGTAGAGRVTSHVYVSGGTFSVTLRITSTDSLSASMTKSLTVAGPPTASFTHTPAGPTIGAPVSFDASASSDPDGTIASYAWDFGDGSLGSGRTVQHTYAVVGSFTVVLRVTDNQGLSDTESRVLIVRAPPVAAFTVAPLKPIRGSPVSFDASSSSDSDGRIVSYTWDFGDGSSPTTSASPTVSHTYANTGTYRVTLRVEDNDGLVSQISKDVRVFAPPVAAFTYSPSNPLSTKPIAFDGSGSSDPDGTIVGFAWDFGDGTRATGATTSHAYSVEGSYVVTLTVTDSDGLTGSATRTLQVARYDPKPPSAAFTFVPMVPRVGQTISFDASGTSDPDANIASYRWDFGDGTPVVTLATPLTTHAYAAYGTYRVTLRVTDADSLWSEVSSRITVYAPPTAAFSYAPPAPLVGETVTFDATASTDPDSAIASYAWDFGDGSRGTGRIATHPYARFGSFSVSLTVVGGDGLDATAVRILRIQVRPSASFTYSPARPLEGQPVAFDASGSSDSDGTISSYAWQFGDGTTGSGKVLSHTYGLFGTYTVRLTVTDADGLTGNTSQSIRILAPPITSFVYSPAKPLQGQVVSFDGSASDRDGTIVSYAWTFGDAGAATGRTTTHTYAVYGTYSVALTVTDSDGLTATATQSVRIHAAPAGSFTFAPARPIEAQAVAFDASASSDPDGTIASYAWDFGDGTTGTGRVPSHAYALFGTYTVRLTVTDSDGFTGTVTQSVRILALPTANFVSSPASPLVGQAVSFDAASSADRDGSIATYAWTFGDGTTGSGRTVTHAYSTHGTFSVALTVTDNDGLQGSKVLALRVLALPVASFVSSPAKPLEGSSVTFDATTSSDPDGTIASYAWDFGDGTTGTGSKPSHAYARYGTYTVTLAVRDNDGLSASTSKSVRIHAAPRASFIFSPAKPLEGQAVSLDASSSSDADGTIVSYVWSFGDTTTGSGVTTSHAYARYGTYTVTLTVTDSDALTAAATQSIRIHAAPVAAFTYSPAKPLEAQAVSFDASTSTDADGTIASYAWDFGDGLAGTGRTVGHTYARYGTYTARLTVTDSDGLTGSATRSVRVYALPVPSYSVSPAKPLAGAATTFDAAGSSDPDGTITTYRWTWGDGTTSGDLTLPRTTKTYALYGTYTVTLQVVDSDGFTASVSQSVRVHAAPVASFTFSPASPASGQPVSFDASASSDPDGTIASYRWIWGDGTPTTDVTTPRTAHTYASFGTYTVSLRVTDSDGLTGEASRQVRVLAPPVASFSYRPLTPTDGQRVSFDGSASADPDGTITQYSWDFGDGASASGPVVDHIFRTGSYPVTLTVIDSDGLMDAESRTVQVSAENRPPTAAFVVTRNLLSVAADASSSTDPEETITSYAWTWGDGTTGSGRVATHAYGAAGVYTISLTITDGGGLTASASAPVTVATSTVDYEFWDFFNVPYGEWWDYRTPSYGNRPMNAECFNATAIANGVCTPRNATIPDIASHPYTNWHPLPGATHPWDANTNAHVYAPYRMRATGDNVPGYSLASPVFLPVFSPSEAAGALLEVRWDLDYMDTATAIAQGAAGCLVSRFDLDGFVSRSIVTVRMDLQESKRIFGVSGSNVQSARNWWSSNVAAGCATQGPVEARWSSFMMAQGGGSTTVGPYDIVNAFGWWYSPFYTTFAASVADDGTTTVTIDHAAWGTDVLLARWSYWGATSYRDNYLDSTRAAGWSGMEPPVEDMTFVGSLSGTSMDFTLTGVVQYQFQELALPGLNGLYDRTDDVPVWTWGPTLADYCANGACGLERLASEVNRYSTLTYLHTTPGSQKYNVQYPYDYVPITWNLKVGHTWTFRMPTGSVAFHDPNLTPRGADPTLGQYVQRVLPLVFDGTYPASYGSWDSIARTLRILGPVATGGPPGSPGNYPLQPYPIVRFRS